MPRRLVLLLTVLAALLARPVTGTPTRNPVLPIVPAPGPVKIDGNWDDWDLSGGILLCGNVEQRLNTASVWLHAMYDDQGLYVLARWTDHSPLNNPIAATDDNGWQGDCLQLRLGFAAPGEVLPNRGSMLRMSRPGVGWRGGGGSAVGVYGWRSAGTDTLEVAYGSQFTPIPRAKVRDALARQAFALYDNEQGYTQELFLPWALISASGKPAPGSDVSLLVQPNYSDAQGQRIADVDVIAPEALADDDRGQYFLQQQQWGRAIFLEKGKIVPPAVKLSNGKEYAVKLVDGLPVVDWQGLVTQDPPVTKLRLAPGLPPARRAEIAAAITRLGADSAAERKAARAQVTAFGAEALPLLEEHFGDPDPELSAVARELWAAIDDARRATAAKAAPPPSAKDPAPANAPGQPVEGLMHGKEIKGAPRPVLILGPAGGQPRPQLQDPQLFQVK